MLNRRTRISSQAASRGALNKSREGYFMFLTVLRRISVIFLVGLSLFFSVQSLLPWLRFWNSDAAAKNEVSIWENRFEAVKQNIPSGVEQVGYIAEWDFPGGKDSDTDQVNEFRMTRFVMAPLIVTRGVDFPWIIGNFSSVKFKSWLKDKIGPYEVQEFSGGIYLIHRVQE
jgi:hypothetical protein